MYQIGVDIGGTNIKIGLVDEAMEIVARTSIRFPHESAQAVVQALSAAIRELLEKKELTPKSLDSIGLLVPGSISPDGASVIDAYNLDFHDVPLRALTQAQFPGVPVFLANDANGAALAELMKGAFVGCQTAVLFTLGTGLGGGIILNGKMFNGGLNHGVELGHAYLVDGGEACTCGNRGCIEAYCAATALAREGVQEMRLCHDSLLYIHTGGKEQKVDAKLVTDCAKEGDEAAVRAFNTYLGHLSSACASIFNILDPEVLALGGGLCAAGDFLFAPLQDLVTEKCFYKTRGKLVPAVMGNDAGIIGAAMLKKNEEHR
jgi:glucokinase